VAAGLDDVEAAAALALEAIGDCVRASWRRSSRACPKSPLAKALAPCALAALAEA